MNKRFNVSQSNPQNNLDCFAKATYLTDPTKHCAFCIAFLNPNKNKYIIHNPNSKNCKIGNKTCLLKDLKFMNAKYACRTCYDQNRLLLESLEEENKTFFINDNCAHNNKCGSYILVSMASLLCLLNFLISLSPHDQPEQQISYIGSVLCITFKLADKSRHIWFSSQKTITKKRGNPSFDVNIRLALANTLAGGRPNTVRKFLQILKVPMTSESAWRSHTEKKLYPVVEEEWELERRHVMEEMNRQLSVSFQEDEQHSRPQRNANLGHAPFVTVTMLWGERNLICAMEHIDRVVTFMSSAVACMVGRQKAFCYVSHNLTVRVSGIVTDACTGAAKSVGQYLKTIWPLIVHSHDLWHKTRKWTFNLSEFCNQRPYFRAHSYKYPLIQQSFEDGELLVGKLKRHFVFCASNCGGDRSAFINTFSEAAAHYGEIFNWSSMEIQAFKTWLTELVEADAEFFIHGLQTSATESFHNICNIYCPKGVPWSFLNYCCRKYLAALDWNTTQREKNVREMLERILNKAMLN